ncbi:hypothetical protein [Burkholderia sola]|uniref:hypothetical protein n=1 Tax=Burkholderia sola TaxID=2843302 RepID=UPI000ADDD993
MDSISFRIWGNTRPYGAGKAARADFGVPACMPRHFNNREDLTEMAAANNPALITAE